MQMLINTGYSMIRVTTPLLIVAMAGVICLKINLINIALEGFMLIGAFSAVIIATTFSNIWVGLLASMVIPMVVALIFAVFAIEIRSNLIVIGLAINIFAIGITRYLLLVFFNSRGLLSPDNISSLPRVSIPFIEKIPVVGNILSGQGILVYVSWIIVIVITIILYKTPFGVHLRAIGEHREAAKTAAIPVKRIEYITVLLSGALAGLGGAQLSIGDLALFNNNMTNGRGFIALAAVFFGAAKPGLTTLGCYLFGFFEALQYRLQTISELPSQLLQTIPYSIVIIVLIIISFQKKLSRKTNGN